MFGPEILARSLSKAVPTGLSGKRWQYHSRGDRHSKIACWGILFDLMLNCTTLREHVAAGKVGFGVNHEMRDFKENRKKNLDLVLCVPNGGRPPTNPQPFAELTDRYTILLNDEERLKLSKLPSLHQTPVGAVQVALEAKACMTAHVKALPRLYDELNSSHATVHGASATAIAVGFIMVNLAEQFRSPGQKVISRHRQPEDANRVLAKVAELPRRTSTAERGFDAVGTVVLHCENDGKSPITLATSSPAPASGDLFHYRQMIRRVAQLYESRFPKL
jgi:hypothetical protein